ncbi:hypothetical protein BDV95DRAFT_480848 [Massariosphaeria phaeospora]|uniref:Uncharacterized protein n=1 Tax=Massariosphaeria phaeospora TaxID=100035 RepID=A0A7C8IEF9_9PLEO|nr:hypothetical protein BDV95DRAFT_480848 [Massariosphaeria phaeospora]
MPKEANKLLGAGAAFTAIGGAYKIGEFLYKAKRLKDVGPANAVYVRLINRVALDLDEVKRLLAIREVHDALESNRDKSKWVYGVMRDVRGALENITPHTERVASDIEGGRRVGIRHRLNWVLNEKEKLENREKELSFAHASLTEVLGYLAPFEPAEPTHKHEKKDKHHSHDTHSHDTRNTKIDVDIRHGGPDRVEERDVYVERDEHGPRRVEEHQTTIEHRGPPRYEERETFIEHEHHERRPYRVEERDVYIDERGPRRYEERETVIERGRDPRHDPRHDPSHEPLGRRPETFEDRVPERETWMQSQANQSRRGPYGEYAEYGAPQPYGAADYGRRYTGDAGFGDQELWIEEKEDFRYDEYGNKLPDRFLPPRYRSRM